MKVFRRLLSLVMLVSVLLATSALVIPEANAKVTVKLRPNARINQSGTVLLLNVSVTCDPVGDVLEAFVTVEQDVFGEGFLNAVVCDGKKHSFLVDVTPFDGVFHPGQASASGLILVCDEQDNCEEGQDARTIKIKRSKKLP